MAGRGFTNMALRPDVAGRYKGEVDPETFNFDPTSGISFDEQAQEAGVAKKDLQNFANAWAHRKTPKPTISTPAAPITPTATAPGGGAVPSTSASQSTPAFEGLQAGGPAAGENILNAGPTFRTNLGQRQPSMGAPVVALQKLRVY